MVWSIEIWHRSIPIDLQLSRRRKHAAYVDIEHSIVSDGPLHDLPILLPIDALLLCERPAHVIICLYPLSGELQLLPNHVLPNAHHVHSNSEPGHINFLPCGIEPLPQIMPLDAHSGQPWILRAAPLAIVNVVGLILRNRPKAEWAVLAMLIACVLVVAAMADPAKHTLLVCERPHERRLHISHHDSREYSRHMNGHCLSYAVNHYSRDDASVYQGGYPSYKGGAACGRMLPALAASRALIFRISFCFRICPISSLSSASVQSYIITLIMVFNPLYRMAIIVGAVDGPSLGGRPGPLFFFVSTGCTAAPLLVTGEVLVVVVADIADTILYCAKNSIGK